MKKYVNKIFAIFTLLVVVSCSSDLIFDEVVDGTTSGGALRNLGETNSLDIGNGASTYSILLEAQDASGGNLLKEVRVNVGFNDEDDTGTETVAMSLFSTIPASSFNETSPTTNGLPVALFSTTFNDLLAHIGSSLTEVSVGDEFVIDFEMELTDGRVFNRGNATGDVTRTGFFSYFNSQFRYTAGIGDPQRLVLSSIGIENDNKLGVLKDGDTDKVILTFDREDPFVVDPVITRTSALGNTDDVIGTLVQSADDKSKYSFTYEAGAAEGDTISFTISGGETVAGFTMKDKTLEAAYIIDNKGPEGSVGPTTISTDVAGRLLNVSVELLYEPLKEGSYEVEISGNSPAFDTQNFPVDVTKGQESIVIQFVPQSGGVALDEGALDFNISITDISDLVGNSTTDVVNVQLGN